METFTVPSATQRSPDPLTNPYGLAISGAPTSEPDQVVEFSSLSAVDEGEDLELGELKQDIRVLRVTQRDHVAVGSELDASAETRTQRGLDPSKVGRGFHRTFILFLGGSLATPASGLHGSSWMYRSIQSLLRMSSSAFARKSVQTRRLRVKTLASLEVYPPRRPSV